LPDVVADLLASLEGESGVGKQFGLRIGVDRPIEVVVDPGD
jgi:hypothetical protein